MTSYNLLPIALTVVALIVGATPIYAQTGETPTAPTAQAPARATPMPFMSRATEHQGKFHLTNMQI